MDTRRDIEHHLQASVESIRTLSAHADIMARIASLMASAFRKGNKVVFFGNGGSAADAQHLAAELAGRFSLDRGPLPAIALTTNSSVLTAIANDYGYEHVFARQVKALVQPGDVVIGISTSGESPNVIKGIEEARRCGATTVAFTGDKGKLKDAAELALCVRSAETPHIQEAHITAGHIICALVEKELFVI